MKPSRSVDLKVLAYGAVLLLACSSCYISVGHSGFHGSMAPYQAPIGLGSFLVFCADIWACVRIWSSPGSTASKLIWTAVVWFFPCGGVFLVWFFF